MYSLPALGKKCPEKLRALLEELSFFADELRAEAEKGLEAVVWRIIARDAIDADDPDIVRFLHLAENFGISLDKFADHLKRYSDSVVYDDRAEAVTLMTIHAAKGLEFPVVFVVGAEEGLLPLAARANMSHEESVRHVEEERRLFYVAMTRAEKILYLTSAENRQAGGEMIQQEQSRFIQEIPGKNYSRAVKNWQERKNTKPKAKQLSLF